MTSTQRDRPVAKAPTTERLRRAAAHERAIPVGLALFCYLLAFWQRPGRTYADTRPELTTDPGLFLERVGSMWTTTADLGHVHSAQFAGYLVPMGPWFAGADAIGLPLWVAQRLWLGTLLAVAAWGAVRLMDELYGGRRGVAHLFAGLLYALNPFVVLYVSRGSVTLLAFAVLPWMLVAAHRGMSEPKGWKWPAAGGVLFALAGGGVNAAVAAPVLVACLLLVVYEVVIDRRPVRDAFALTWRAGICLVVASLWWLVPVALSGQYAGDFIAFTEQPDAIWATTSMSESLRLMGYWISYFASGFGASEPTLDVSATYLFNPFAVATSLLVPVLALGGFYFTRRWRYAPFFVLLAVATLVFMTMGFPEGKPLERLLTEGYYAIDLVQFLRTPYKAAPLVAIAIACMGGAGVAVIAGHARKLDRLSARRRRAAIAVTVTVLVALPVGWALPLFGGTAVDSEIAYDEVPGAWRAAMADVDREVGPNERAMVLPGQLFGIYRWGRIGEPVGPTLASAPVLQRQIVRYGDARPTQMQADVDDVIQQQRLVPGQLPPLLQLLGVSQVVVGTDGRPEQTGEVAAPNLAETLEKQPGFARPIESYGRPRRNGAATGRGTEPRTLRQLRRYAVARPAGVVRVHPRGGSVVVDGDADGVIEAAAHRGGLDPARALVYAGDQDAADLREHVAKGARLVLTDSNRRRTVANARITESRGHTLGPDEGIERDLASYDLFGHGPNAQTVAQYGGLRYLRSPQSAAFALLPEYRPFAALDGRLDRPWVASAQELSRRWIEFGLDQPRRIDAIRVHPHRDALGATSAIAVSVNGGPERTHRLRPGWNRVPIGADRVDRLRVRLATVSQAVFSGRGGLDEVEIPGLRVTERLRLPTRAAELARGVDLSRNQVDVLLQRTTADAPYRAGSFVANAQAENPVDMVDAEPGISRRIELPAPRSFEVDGWASFSPDAPDPQIDALAGMPAGWRFASSSRFEGVPRRRASAAFDGSARTQWIGHWTRSHPAWIEVRAPEPFTVGRFRLRADPTRNYLSPTRVRVTTDAGRSPVLPVSRNGIVRLPRATSTRRLRIDVVATVALSGLGAGRLLAGVALAEVIVPGLEPPRARRSGTFATPCGSLAFRAGGGEVLGRVRGSIAQMDAGEPVQFEDCGPRRSLRMAAGANDFDAPAGTLLRPDHVRLSSAPTSPAVGAGNPDPRVTAPGSHSATKVDDVGLNVPGQSWLVLARSYSTGWRAWCRDADGGERSLGRPEPVDGFANGWRIDRGCTEARFAFAPQRAASAARWISALALLALIAVAAWGLRRRRRVAIAGQRRVRPAAPLLNDLPDAGRRLHWPAALALAVVLGAIGGVVIALRAGAVIFAAALILAIVGVTARRLIALAAVALATVPILYLVRPSPDLGGYFFDYAYHYSGAHWMATAAVCALAAAAVLDALTLRRRGAQRDPA